MDHQTQVFLQEAKTTPSKNLPIEKLRNDLELLAGTSTASIKEVKNITITGPNGSIPLRLYFPNQRPPYPVFINFHGGGWVRGNLNTHDAFCREICSQSECLVVAVDYHLAPEYKFPKPLEDCYAATQWVADHIQEYNGDPKKIAVGGDSGGGTFAAVVSQMAKERGNLEISYQVLIYPATNYNFDTLSFHRFAEGYFLSRETVEWYWDLYLSSAEDRKNPQASPLQAKHLEGLPPCLLVVAEFDPLHDEGLAYAYRLKKAGVPTEILSYNSIHFFIFFAHRLDIGKKAIHDIALRLKIQMQSS